MLIIKIFRLGQDTRDCFSCEESTIYSLYMTPFTWIFAKVLYLYYICMCEKRNFVKKKKKDENLTF